MFPIILKLIEFRNSPKISGNEEKTCTQVFVKEFFASLPKQAGCYRQAASRSWFCLRSLRIIRVVGVVLGRLCLHFLKFVLPSFQPQENIYFSKVVEGRWHPTYQMAVRLSCLWHRSLGTRRSSRDEGLPLKFEIEYQSVQDGIKNSR